MQTNTIKYADLKQWYLNNDEARANAKKYFGNKQPSIYRTGFYSAPSWNWGYHIGLVEVRGYHYTAKTKQEVHQVFEAVTQFGSVVAAMPVQLPIMEAIQ